MNVRILKSDIKGICFRRSRKNDCNYCPFMFLCFLCVFDLIKFVSFTAIFLIKCYPIPQSKINNDLKFI